MAVERKTFNQSVTGKFIASDSVEESMDAVLTAPMLSIVSEGAKGYLSLASLGGVAMLAGLAYAVQLAKPNTSETQATE